MRGTPVTDIQPYSFNNGLSRDARRAGRVISRHQSGGQVRTVVVDVNTDVTMAKVEALTAATGSAMTNVVRVAQAQHQLELLAPDAAGRLAYLAYLAETHALAMGDLMQDLRRDLRRV